MSDICSIWAYEEIKESGELGRQQSQYLSIFVEENRPLTALQVKELVEKKFNRKLSERSGRIDELVKMGYLRKIDKVKCPLTNKTVNRWEWTGNKKSFATKDEIIRCPHCSGQGRIIQKVYITNEVN